MNEDQLRAKIIAILRSSPNVQNVQDRCGPVEYGIDVTFQKRDIFGIWREYGIQIKTKDLRVIGNKASSGVKEIITQLAVAFGHDSFGYHSNNTIDAVYIVSSGEINQFAKDYIKACRVGFRELYFIDKQYLDRFLNQPETTTVFMP